MFTIFWNTRISVGTEIKKNKNILSPVVIVQADDPGYDEQDAANKVDE